MNKHIINEPYWQYTLADFPIFLGIYDGTLKETIELIYKRGLQDSNILIKYHETRIILPLKEAKRILKLNQL